MGSKDDSIGLAAVERAKAIAVANMSADAIEAEGKSAQERGQPAGITVGQALTRSEEWPEAPKTMGQTLIKHLARRTR